MEVQHRLQIVLHDTASGKPILAFPIETTHYPVEFLLQRPLSTLSQCDQSSTRWWSDDVVIVFCLRCTQSSAAPQATHAEQAHHQSQPSASATPATQMERRCQQVPRKARRRPGRLTATKRATRAIPVPQVPRLPRKTKVAVAMSHTCHPNGTSMSPSATNDDQARNQPSAISATPSKKNVTKRHTRHAKRRWMSPCAMPAAQSAAACPKCHARHAKRM